MTVWTQHNIEGWAFACSLPPLGIMTESSMHQPSDSSLLTIVWFLSVCGPFQVTVLQLLSLAGYCSWDWSKFEINLVQCSGLSVSLRVGTTSLSNWGLIGVESMDWMSVWAARIYSTAVSGLEHNSTKHLWCELPTWLLSSFLKYTTQLQYLQRQSCYTACWYMAIRTTLPDRDINCQYSRTNKANLHSRAEIDFQTYDIELPNWCCVFHFLSFINPYIFVLCSLLGILYITARLQCTIFQET